MVNPGKFTKKDKVNGDDDEIPYILLFDSLLYHNRNSVKNSIRQWLKVVYEKEKKSKIVICLTIFVYMLT